ncbi:MAG: response regulator [Bacteroidales bacterium]
MSQSDLYRILIVDDEPDILEFLSYTLRREGFEVMTAPDGRKGVEMVGSFHPDLVLLDVMMPGIDGIEATRADEIHSGTGNMVICFPYCKERRLFTDRRFRGRWR